MLVNLLDPWRSEPSNASFCLQSFAVSRRFDTCIHWYFHIHVGGRPRPVRDTGRATRCRSEEHTSELQSLMRISYAVFCLKKKNKQIQEYTKYLLQTNKTTTSII